MAEQGKLDELVTLQELAVSNAYEIAALVVRQGKGGKHREVFSTPRN